MLLSHLSAELEASVLPNVTGINHLIWVALLGFCGEINHAFQALKDAFQAHGAAVSVNAIEQTRNKTALRVNVLLSNKSNKYDFLRFD